MAYSNNANEQNLKMMLDWYADMGKDPYFADDYKRKDKSIKECLNIFAEALQKKGASGVAVNAQTMLNWAIEYYHNDGLTFKDVNFDGMDIPKKAKANNSKTTTKTVAINHTVNSDDDIDIDMDDDIDID